MGGLRAKARHVPKIGRGPLADGLAASRPALEGAAGRGRLAFLKPCPAAEAGFPAKGVPAPSEARHGTMGVTGSRFSWLSWEFVLSWEGSRAFVRFAAGS